MRGWKLLLIMAAVLLLTGCMAPAEVPAEMPAFTIPEPEPLPAPAPVFFPEPVPVTVPEPGPGVTVDGTELASGSLRFDGIACVQLTELTEALGTELSWDRPAGSFLWREEPVVLSLYLEALYWGDAACDLPGGLREWEGQPWIPLESLCAALGIGFFTDESQNHLYATPAAGTWAIPEGIRVPILMYHGVTDDVWGMSDLFVSPSRLEEQLQYLEENGFTPIWFSDLAYVDQIEKPIILTFDDGYMDNYTELYPLLQKYQMKATIFVITDTIDLNPRNLTADQIRELSASGLVEIQSHTVTHPYLTSLTPNDQRWELAQSKLVLTRLTGKEPYVICYPSGHRGQDTLEIARELYVLGLDMNGGDYTTGSDPYTIPRWHVSRFNSLATFIDQVE